MKCLLDGIPMTASRGANGHAEMQKWESPGQGDDTMVNPRTGVPGLKSRDASCAPAMGDGQAEA